MNGPLCVGLHRLFDSTALEDHQRARNLCLAPCPMLEACRGILEDTERPLGTWAGRLFGRSGPKIGAEEIMFTATEARMAHAAHLRGEDSERVRVGERVYQRQKKRLARARRMAVA